MADYAFPIAFPNKLSLPLNFLVFVKQTWVQKNYSIHILLAVLYYQYVNIREYSSRIFTWLSTRGLNDCRCKYLQAANTWTFNAIVWNYWGICYVKWLIDLWRIESVNQLIKSVIFSSRHSGKFTPVSSEYLNVLILLP